VKLRVRNIKRKGGEEKFTIPSCGERVETIKYLGFRSLVWNKSGGGGTLRATIVWGFAGKKEGPLDINRKDGVGGEREIACLSPKGHQQMKKRDQY